MNDLSSQGVQCELEQQQRWNNHYKGDGPEPDDPVAQTAGIVEFAMILVISLGLSMGLWALFVALARCGNS